MAKNFQLKPVQAGAICAVLYLLFKLVLYFANLQHQVLVKFPILPLLVLVIAAIVYSQLRYRYFANDFSVFEATKQGGKAALTAAALTALTVFLYYNYIDTAFHEIEITKAVQLAREKLDGKQFAQRIKIVEFVNNTQNKILFTLAGLSVFGLIGSFVITAVIKATSAMRH